MLTQGALIRCTNGHERQKGCPSFCLNHLCIYSDVYSVYLLNQPSSARTARINRWLFGILPAQQHPHIRLDGDLLPDSPPPGEKKYDHRGGILSPLSFAATVDKIYSCCHQSLTTTSCCSRMSTFASTLLHLHRPAKLSCHWIVPA